MKAVSLRRRWIPPLMGAVAGFAAILLSWTVPGIQADNALYDFLMRANPASPRPMNAQLLVLDDKTLMAMGGVRGMRRAIAQALETIRGFSPAVVAVDLTLAEPGDPGEDARLAAAFSATPQLVLASEMLSDGSGWQDPIPLFRQSASAIGHVNALPDPYDKINRMIALERVAGRAQRWALSLEAYRLWKGVDRIESAPDAITAGPLTVASRWDAGRPLRVRYRPASQIPSLTLLDLLQDSSLATRVKGKVVFIGVTAQSAVEDRLPTPVSLDLPMPGVMIHAQAFETMAAGELLADAPLWVVVLLALLLGVAVGLCFAFIPGRGAYAAAGALVLFAHLLPQLLWRQEIVVPGVASAASAWFSALACGGWQYLVVRHQLHQSRAETTRYQQAFHFVAHEMRTPLTAIQGSSELITRYNLPEAKRKEIGEMINAESKRLARMISTFLDVERLSAGQMELRKTQVALSEVVDSCLRRAQPLAERKNIRIDLHPLPSDAVHADRELMEYAFYNLLTNAIKYSPADSQVTVAGERANGELKLSVSDQGMGMDEKELKQIFTRFYRTSKAVASGETGTGIGLSIVDQIVTHHGGRIEVRSRPREGSCFTIVLPATIN